MSEPEQNRRAFARAMRANPTDAERKLWRRLRHDIPLVDSHFRRQAEIGRFIVDFASRGQRLVIELDGGQHGTPADQARTREIEAEGYRVLRFWNHEVLSNVDGVLEVIQHALLSTPTPDPSPQRGGETPRRTSRDSQSGAA